MKNVITEKRKKIKCPCCKGTGEIEMVIKTIAQVERSVMVRAARVLRERGMTIREIAKTLGYKHPGSISDLLK